jgi:hypothetical protein
VEAPLLERRNPSNSTANAAIWCGLFGGLLAAVATQSGLTGLITPQRAGIATACLAALVLVSYGLRAIAKRDAQAPRMRLKQLRLKEPSPEQIRAALQSVKDCLHRPMSRDDAIDWLAGSVSDPDRRSAIVASFDAWYEPALALGQELWMYSSDEQSWMELRGHAGLALVKDGEVIDTWLIELN